MPRSLRRIATVAGVGAAIMFGAGSAAVFADAPDDPYCPPGIPAGEPGVPPLPGGDEEGIELPGGDEGGIPGGDEEGIELPGGDEGGIPAGDDCQAPAPTEPGSLAVAGTLSDPLMPQLPATPATPQLPTTPMLPGVPA